MRNRNSEECKLRDKLPACTPAVFMYDNCGKLSCKYLEKKGKSC